MVIATGLLGGISNVSESAVHEVVSTRAECFKLRSAYGGLEFLLQRLGVTA